jgi:hypothetical protein
MTGPTYPVSGTAQLGTVPVSYKLLRSQGGSEDAPVRVSVSDTSISAVVEWKRYNSDDTLGLLQMQRVGGTLDPAGRAVRHLPSFQAGAARTAFNYIDETTFYSRHGNWFVWLCAALTAITLAWELIHHRGAEEHRGGTEKPATNKPE